MVSTRQDFGAVLKEETVAYSTGEPSASALSEVLAERSSVVGLEVFSDPWTMSYGQISELGAGAKVFAVAGSDKTKAVCFAYCAGAELAIGWDENGLMEEEGKPSPNLRIALPLYHQALRAAGRAGDAPHEAGPGARRERTRRGARPRPHLQPPDIRRDA